MVPFVANALCCEINGYLPKIMPRVVQEQRAKFENDELFRKLSRETEIKYSGFRERPIDERQIRFQSDCREGVIEIAFMSTGTNLPLCFASKSWSDRPEDRIPSSESVNFSQEPGKVHLKSQFIMNGVCVIWRGWLDIVRLEGLGCLEFDTERAQVEESLLREQLTIYERQMHNDHRRYQEEQNRQAEAEAETRERARDRSTSDSGASD